MAEERKLFAWGFIAGALVLGGEMAFFVLNMLIAAIINMTPSPQAGQALATISTEILLLTVTGVIINILIGFFAPVPFSLGCLTGNFMMIALVSAFLPQFVPAVLTGIIIAAAVLVGLCAQEIWRRLPEIVRAGPGDQIV